MCIRKGAAELNFCAPQLLSFHAPESAGVWRRFLSTSEKKNRVGEEQVYL